MTGLTQTHKIGNYIAAAVVWVIFGGFVIFQDRQNLFKDQRFEATIKLEHLASNFTQSLSVVKSLGLFASTTGGMDQQTLEAFRDNLILTKRPELVPNSLQVAPNGIVTFEAPWTGGPHIGHDLFSDPERRTEAISAAQNMTSVVQGPLQLKQGGTAVIVRHPILDAKESSPDAIWGLAVALVDWDPIAQNILKIEQNIGVKLKVYIETAGKNRLAYPEIAADAIVPPDVQSVPFINGMIHFSIEHSYRPSISGLLTLIFTALMAFGVAAYLQLSSERRLLEAETEFSESFRTLLASGTSNFLISNENMETILVSKSAMDLFGLGTEKDAIDNLSVSKIISSGELNINEVIKLKNLVYSIPFMPPEVFDCQVPDRKNIQVKLSMRWVKNPLGLGLVLYTNIDNVTALSEANRDLELLVNHDELTGLYSRRGVKDLLLDGTRAIDFGVYILDLDHFKSVNDSYGHIVGDNLLSAVGETLTRLTEANGFGARLGGEEFAIFREWQGWQEAIKFGEELRSKIEETYIQDRTRKIFRTASIGIAYLSESSALSNAMNMADVFAREAKSLGRNRVCAANDAELRKLTLSGRFITAEKIQSALEAGEFYYEVQPIVSNKDRKIHGFEALIRWQESDGRVLQPSQFLDLYNVVIGQPRYAAINNAMRKDLIAGLSDFPNAYVSFNYTLEQLAYAGAAHDLETVYKGLRDHPDRLIMIELSELDLSNRTNFDVLKEEIVKLSENGFYIALDDFGVASSNLSRLKEYPIDFLKLDKSLIDNLAESTKEQAIVKGIARTVQSLDVEVIIEGVETIEQEQILKSSDLNLCQGYLYFKPMRTNEVRTNLASWTPAGGRYHNNSNQSLQGQ